MLRRGLGLLLLAAAVSSTAFLCERQPRKNIGYTLQDGRIAVLYNPCKESATISRLTLLEVSGIAGDDNDRVLWDVRSPTPQAIRSWVIGEAPPGFETVLSFIEPAARDAPLSLRVEGKKPSIQYSPFRLSELMPDMVLSVHRYYEREGFLSLDTCN